MGPGLNVRLPGDPLTLPGPAVLSIKPVNGPQETLPALSLLFCSPAIPPPGSLPPFVPLRQPLPAPSDHCRLAQASHQRQFLSSSKASSSFRLGTHAVITLVPLADCPPPRMSLPGKATACHLPGHTAQGLWNEVATS